jgi:hypothetical protein
MNDRYDPNWGKFGNPNKEEWYRYKRHYSLVDRKSLKEKFTISLWTLYWIVCGLLLVTAFVPSLRDWVYSGIHFTESWYQAVDNLLDAFNVPKVPY